MKTDKGVLIIETVAERRGIYKVNFYKFFGCFIRDISGSVRVTAETIEKKLKI